MSAGSKNFDSLKLNRQLLNAIEAVGYKQPTSIQQKAIPIILAGHDVMGIAQTGTGKTAAFVLPVLMKVKYAQEQEPRALILAPTKELVLQIEQNIKKYSVFTDLRSIALYGGIGPTSQIKAIQEGVDIVVSTPGRFLDIYTRGELIVKKLKILVLDEADKMMDMGFMPQIRKILEVIPVKRQNLLFSATMPPKVIKLSEEFLEFPEIIEVAPSATTADTIDQKVYYVPNLATKINLLSYFFEHEKFYRVIIFVKSRETANNVYSYLLRSKIGEVGVIHSNRGQNTRINTMNAFKDGDIRVLVTTDVTARGIDVTDVSHVINFDVPIIYEDYVHRIGRTGRAEKTGVSITFVNDAEKKHVERIEGIIRMKIPVHKIPSKVEITETPFEEKQEIARELDHQRRKEDPDFKGAFHEKKKKYTGKSDAQKSGRRRGSKKRR